MKKIFLDCALNSAQQMIKFFYVDKNVDEVCKFLDKNNFSFNCFIDGKDFDSVENFHDYLQNSLDLIKFYEIADENYSIAANSQDSCIVDAKIISVDKQSKKICDLQFYFYFIQREQQIFCHHYHVVRPFKINNFLPKEYVIHINEKILIYPRLKKIKIDEKIIELTAMECDIFLFLLENLNKPISSAEIYKNIWGTGFSYSTSNVLPTHINHIRKKIQICDSMKIIYLRNQGYCLKIL